MCKHVLQLTCVYRFRGKIMRVDRSYYERFAFLRGSLAYPRRLTSLKYVDAANHLRPHDLRRKLKAGTLVCLLATPFNLSEAASAHHRILSKVGGNVQPNIGAGGGPDIDYEPAPKRCSCTPSGQASPPTRGDPVDVTTGVLREEIIDYSSADGNMMVGRTYNSDDNPTLAFGYSWTYSNVVIGQVYTNNVPFDRIPFQVVFPDGGLISFIYSSSTNTWNSATGNIPSYDRMTLTANFTPPTSIVNWPAFFQNTTVSYRVNRGDGSSFILTAKPSPGVLVPPAMITSEMSPTGFVKTYQYDLQSFPTPKLMSITGSDRRTINYQYSQGDVSQVNLSDNTYLLYKYTGTGQTASLTAVEHHQSNGTKIYSQGYVYFGSIAAGLLSGVVDALGVQRTLINYQIFPDQVVRVQSTVKLDNSELKL